MEQCYVFHSRAVTFKYRKKSKSDIVFTRGEFYAQVEYGQLLASFP